MSFLSGTKISAQTQDQIVVETTGYSVLSASSFVFGGYYSGNLDKKGFTTYFEFKKNDGNLSTGAEETIKIVRNIGVRESNDFYTSPELNLFSTYYFRAVGYFNDSPSQKLYGSTLRLDTGPSFIGAIPFTVEGNNPLVAVPYIPTEVLAGAFFLSTTDKTANIRTKVYNENPQGLKLKIEYGEDDFDFESDFLQIDQAGNISVTLNNLNPETKYYFRLFDTTKNLDSSGEGTFATQSTTGSQILASVSVDGITENSATFRAAIYNENPQNLKLKVEYGENDFTAQSGFLSIDKSGNASLALTGLKSGTVYKYRLINTAEVFDVTDTHIFTTKTTPTTKPTTPTAPPAGSTGLVPCDGSVANPCGFKQIGDLINTVIGFIFKNIVLPLAAIMFAYAGFLLVTSGGETSKREEAKKIFTNVTIGLVIAAAAFLIVQTVLVIVGYNTSVGINWFGFEKP